MARVCVKGHSRKKKGGGRARVKGYCYNRKARRAKKAGSKSNRSRRSARRNAKG